MDDVRGDFLGPPHGTTPAYYTRFRSVFHLFRVIPFLFYVSGLFQVTSSLKTKVESRTENIEIFFSKSVMCM